MWSQLATCANPASCPLFDVVFLQHVAVGTCLGIARDEWAEAVAYTREDADAYSAFSGTDLAERLRSRGVKRLLVGGLATDYCVLNSVRDALKEGFGVLLLKDAIRAVNVNAGDGERAEREMREGGAVAVTHGDFAA